MRGFFFSASSSTLGIQSEFFLYFGKPVLINKFSKPGDIIMFKSSIYHKVNPVTKGSRNTLAFFLKGPRFI